MNQSNPLLTLPSAIIIAGVIIAGAIIWSVKPATQAVKQGNSNTQQQVKLSISPVTKDDHIFGNPNAKIKIVEYSDPSCPYCKVFHPTMQKIMTEYGASGTVAWIYRSFPLDKPNQNGQILHPNAGHEAQSFECAAGLGGNEKFWAYINKFYETTQSDKGIALDQSKLPEIAKSVGLDVVAFNECLTSGTYKDKVEKQYQMGVNDGVSGTPFSIITTSSGINIPINGAQPFTAIKATIDSILAETK